VTHYFFAGSEAPADLDEVLNDTFTEAANLDDMLSENI